MYKKKQTKMNHQSPYAVSNEAQNLYKGNSGKSSVEEEQRE